MNRVAWVLIVLLVLLGLGWVWGAINNWDEIASRPVRLAYIILDFGLVIPAGLIAAFGLKAGKRWAFPLFVFVLGALFFDVAHGVFYLLWDNYFGVPWIAALAMLVVLAGYTVYAIRTVEAERGP